MMGWHFAQKSTALLGMISFFTPPPVQMISWFKWVGLSPKLSGFVVREIAECNQRFICTQQRTNTAPTCPRAIDRSFRPCFTVACSRMHSTIAHLCLVLITHRGLSLTRRSGLFFLPFVIYSDIWLYLDKPRFVATYGLQTLDGWSLGRGS